MSIHSVMILSELSLAGQASVKRAGSLATALGNHPQGWSFHLPPVGGAFTFLLLVASMV